MGKQAAGSHHQVGNRLSKHRRDVELETEDVGGIWNLAARFEAGADDDRIGLNGAGESEVAVGPAEQGQELLDQPPVLGGGNSRGGRIEVAPEHISRTGILPTVIIEFGADYGGVTS